MPEATVAEIVPAPKLRWKRLCEAGKYMSEQHGLFRDGLLVASYTIGERSVWVTEHSLTSSKSKRQITVISAKRAREVCVEIATGTFPPTDLDGTS